MFETQNVKIDRKKIDNAKLQAILDEDNTETQQEL